MYYTGEGAVAPLAKHKRVVIITDLDGTDTLYFHHTCATLKLSGRNFHYWYIQPDSY